MRRWRRSQSSGSGAAEERDGKLHFHGTVTSEDQKNKIWDAIKTIPDWQREIPQPAR